MQFEPRQTGAPPSPVHPTGFFTGVQIRPVIIGVVVDYVATSVMIYAYFFVYLANQLSKQDEVYSDAIIDRPVGSYRGLEENSRLNLLDGHESGIGLATSIWISLWHLRYSRWQRRFDLEIPIRMFASTSVIGTGVSPNIAKRKGRSTK